VKNVMIAAAVAAALSQLPAAALGWVARDVLWRGLAVARVKSIARGGGDRHACSAALRSPTIR
jgi:hypothetical protein